mgnify:CR=1 FL=1
MNELNEDKYSKGKSFMQIEPKKKLGHLFSSNFPIHYTRDIPNMHACDPFLHREFYEIRCKLF